MPLFSQSSDNRFTKDKIILFCAINVFSEAGSKVDIQEWLEKHMQRIHSMNEFEVSLRLKEQKVSLDHNIHEIMITIEILFIY